MKENRWPNTSELTDRLENDAENRDDILNLLSEISWQLRRLRLATVILLPAGVVFGVALIAWKCGW